jgi:hypothetical protein
MWSVLREELREVVWLVSVIGGLSVVFVASAVLLSFIAPAL